MLALSGCSGLQQVEPPPVSTIYAPVWNSARIQQTLELLQRHGSDSGGESAEQLEAFVDQSLSGLQSIMPVEPGLSQLSARARFGRGLNFDEGYELWPDARSDTGTIAATSLQSANAVAGGASAKIALVADKSANCPRSDSQALVIILGSLDVRPSRQTIPRCIMVQLTYSAWTRLTGMDEQAAIQWLEAGTPLALQSALHVTITRIRRPDAGRFGLLRLLPGKDPSLSSELVIVGADLNRGNESDWITPVVLVEMAGQAAQWSQQGGFPRRSILFALWPDRDVLTDFLAQPYWPMDATHIMLHVGSRPEVSASVPVRTLRLPPPESPGHHDRALNMLREILLTEAGGT